MTMKKLLMCAVTMLLVLCLTAGPASAARAAGSIPPSRASAIREANHFFSALMFFPLRFADSPPVVRD